MEHRQALAQNWRHLRASTHRPPLDLTSAELVVGAVTVEVVALAVLAAVNLGGVIPLLAFAGPANTVTVVATDICAVVFPAVGVQVLGADFVFAALAEPADTAVVTPDAQHKG